MRQQDQEKHIEGDAPGERENQEQKEMLKAFLGTVQHFFGGMVKLFEGVMDVRDPDLITYPMEALLSTGVLMYLFRWGSRRQIKDQLRGNGPSESQYAAWFGVEEVPHGDTLNYGFKRLEVDDVQEVDNCMVERLIRKKVLYRWRLYNNFLIAVDGTGLLT